MDLNIFFAFVIATSIMIALPGPSVILTVAHSISFGWRSALFTVLGATVGIGIQLAITSIGLSSLLNTMVNVFEWIRWAGAFYLIYLGIKQWRSAGEAIDFDTPASNRNLFIQGLVVTIPNPKSLIFIAAFLPQFIDINNSINSQMAVLIPTFLIITFVVTSLWALVAGNIREFFRSSKSLKSLFRSTGSLMILTGLGLAFARRGN